METSTVWNPLGQGTRSEEQILFLKFSGANVGGHGRLSKGANILERIKLSRIGLVDVFTQTVSMHVSTENEKKNKNIQEWNCEVLFFRHCNEKENFSRQEENIISTLSNFKTSILRTREFLRNVSSFRNLPKYIRIKKDSHVTGHTCLSENITSHFTRDTKVLKYSNALSTKRVFAKRSHGFGPIKPRKLQVFVYGAFLQARHTHYACNQAS